MFVVLKVWGHQSYHYSEFKRNSYHRCLLHDSVARVHLRQRILTDNDDRLAVRKFYNSQSGVWDKVPERIGYRRF